MRLILKILAATLVSIFILVVMIVFILPKTGPGQALIDRYSRPLIENAVQTQLNSTISYDRPHGALPGELILENVVLSHDGEAWARVDKVLLQWSPLAMLQKEIVIERLIITEADYLRPHPALPQRPDDDEEGDGEDGFSLPEIRIGKLAIKDLSVHEPIFGERYDVVVAGTINLNGRQVTTDIDFDAMSGSDMGNIKASFDGKGLFLNTSIISQPTGLVSRLARAEGAVWLTVDGEGPLENWVGQIETEIGQYGALAGTAAGNVKDLSSAQFAFRARPGPLVPENVRSLTGDSFSLRGTTERRDGRLFVEVLDSNGRFGALTGTLNLDSQTYREGEIEMTGSLTEDILSEYGVDFLAGPIEISSAFDGRDDGWLFEGEITTKPLTLTVQDGRSTTSAPFAGVVRLDARKIPLDVEALTPLLGQGGTATTNLVYTDKGLVRLTELNGQLGRTAARRLTFAGNAAYDTQNNNIDTTLSLRAGPALITEMTAVEKLEGALSAQVSAKGPLDALTATIRADIPDGMLNEQRFAAGRLSADFAGLPGAPHGTLNLKGRGDSYQSSVQLQYRDNALILPDIRFAAEGLNVEGNGRYRPDTQSGEVNLELRARRNTVLLTGHQIAGAMTVNASLDAEADQLQADITARRIQFEDYRIRDLTLTARGPLDAINYAVEADEADLTTVYLAALTSRGTIRRGDASTRIDIESLTAAVDADTEERRITLIQPTTVSLGEAVEVAETRLDWLGDGRLAGSARFSGQRWVAKLEGTAMAIPQISAPADFTLDLDTDEQNPARFSVTARATTEDDGTFVLTGDGLWTGQQLASDAKLANGKGVEVATASIRYPLELRRTGDGLSINIPQSGLEGQLLVDGPIEGFSAFMPELPLYLAGQMNADLRVTGQPNAPQAAGTIRLRNGQIEDQTVGLTLTEVTADATVSYSPEGSRFDLTMNAAGADGDTDTIRLTGTGQINEAGSSLDMRLRTASATLVDNPELELITSADLALTGSLQEMLLAGSISIDTLDAQIPSLSGNGGNSGYTPVNVVRTDGELAETQEVRVQQSSGPTINLDLKVRGENEIFIRGRGLNSEWSTNLEITGTTSEPVIAGRVTSRDGTFDFAGRQFDVTDGQIIFSRQNGLNPRLDVTAAYEAPEVTAFVNVDGPADNPRISLSSNPSRPQEEIMSLILFGKNPTQLSALESLQIANAVAQLSGALPGSGGPGITDRLRSGIGLDALSLGVDPETGRGTLSVGKYISDDVYVSARQSAGDTGTAITVTYEITDNVTLESTLKPNGAQNVSANYKKDY